MMRSNAQVGMLALLLTLAGCGGGGDQKASSSPDNLSGEIKVDGSSTVLPITTAMAEEFNREHHNVRVPVGQSGTGGGFRRFCAGETDLSNASRQIKDEEKAACAQNGVEYLELTVAYDGITVVVNPQNNAVTCLTAAELKKIWEPNSTVKKSYSTRP